ncbi:hypothetical protein K505DRAFT_338561 [Melanomma pulvis-pyrius CBS 109.77]|uniref:Osmotin, thaumatin-like protein n=1 Tax=Melanomma pulvis-pyrius CBS 109.77 TaxID=1314802 RepID=A0A6A6X928_9PLEO|nr:hypothetical protein K505DRAFT_338561 [Melanomma pulvis-pyrius CBS 109.77]
MLSFSSFSAIALQALIGSALAGNAIINNHCGYDVHLLSTSTNAQSVIPAGQTFVEGLTGGAGKSLKLAKDPAGFWAHGITQFEYTVTDTLWYDISLIDCANGNDAGGCPGHEGGIRLEATGDGCAVAECAANSYCPDQAYFVWNDDLATKSCGPGQAGGDVTMTLCSGAGMKKRVAGRIQY